MRWCRFGMDRIDTDGSRAPVQCWLAQGDRTQSPVNACPSLLVPADFHTPGTVTPAFRRLFRKQQLRGSACSLGKTDRAPFTFFANRSAPGGNGSIEVLDFVYDPTAPLLVWAHWPLSARDPGMAGRTRFFFQEPRTLVLGKTCERHYPGDGIWQELAPDEEEERVLDRCGNRMHLWCRLKAMMDPPVEVPEPMEGNSTYRTRLWGLPVEEIVERHYEARGGRSKSVLTFDRKPKPW